MKAAIYARYSSDLSRDASIEDQVRLCRAFAAGRGWEVAQVFEDRAFSGASALRPGYQALVAAVQGGEVAVVLAEALDRLSRDQEDIAALHKRLRFLGVGLVTVTEGEIGDLHIGLKGAMNAIYLKDLADKTRRGLEGRVRAGRSGGGLAYGYAVVPGEERGGRTIVPEEAAIVREIFEAFAAGRSPKAIGHALNDAGVPGPRGTLWRDTAIRGHRARATGILNNELYIGRLVWNRLRYVKDPATGKRVSRTNPESAWIVEEVPALRIVEDALWEAVRGRQADLDATPRVQAMRATRFWERRRPVHLLTGLARCGACGGTLTAIGRDYLACVNARKLNSCTQTKSLRRDRLEAFVLGLIREQLMQPEAVAAFTAAYHAEINRGRDGAAAARRAEEKELREISTKLDGLVDAIADGLRSEGLLARLEALEARKAELEARLAAPPPSPVRLHPNLAEVYRAKVADLHAALADPDIRDEAIGLLRGLIAAVVLHQEDDGWRVELVGEILGLVALGASNDKAPPPDLSAEALCSAKLVAGARSGHDLPFAAYGLPVGEAA